MLSEIDTAALVQPALLWYQEHKRDLPWRSNRDPYRIWVSEIMLQQTRVEAVKPYFLRFMEELPTIKALAACPEDKLLKLWEGLGYYSRARNLKKAAQVIVTEYGGQMPADHAEILKLPGIGPYTAGAIASIAFGLPYPAVDGNVLRILSRVSDDDRDILCDSTKKDVAAVLQTTMQEVSQKNDGVQEIVRETAAPLFPNPCGTLNQALMEIGATVCVPNGEPKCEVCPWSALCLSKKRGTTEALPVRIKKTKRRVEKRTVFLIRDGERILLQKRPENGLLAGLYEFPNVEGHLNETEAIQFVRGLSLDPLRVEALPAVKHLFSHIEWRMKGYLIRVASFEETGGLLIDLAKIQKEYAIPSAFAAYAKLLGLDRGVS